MIAGRNVPVPPMGRIILNVQAVGRKPTRSTYTAIAALGNYTLDHSAQTSMNGYRKGGLIVLAATTGFGTLAIVGTVADPAGVSTSTRLPFRFVSGAILLLAG